MKVRELEKKDVRDAVRILILCFDRELNGIFGDVELARELLFRFFSIYSENCYVAEAERVVGFASYSSKKVPISSFLRKELGFMKGTKASLLIRYLCPVPKRGEGVLNFVAVSPLRRNEGVGSALLSKIIEDAGKKGIKSLKSYVSVANDAGIGLLIKFGFKVEKMIDHNFAEKNFGVRQWYLMRLKL